MDILIASCYESSKFSTLEIICSHVKHKRKKKVCEITDYSIHHSEIVLPKAHGLEFEMFSATLELIVRKERGI